MFTEEDFEDLLFCHVFSSFLWVQLDKENAPFGKGNMGGLSFRCYKEHF